MTRESIQEKDDRIVGLLAEAWNAFLRVSPTHPDDLRHFRDAIHSAQGVMAMRQLRRQDPERWPMRS